MKKTYLAILFLLAVFTTHAQDDDLLQLLGEEETTDYATASFKANRVINLHSLESTKKRVLDVKISHRLGAVSGGIREFFGLDQASIRIGGDYGITDQLMVGVGRSSFQKTFDGYVKYKFLRQSTGTVNMPVSMLVVVAAGLNSAAFPLPDRNNLFSSRLSYTSQLIVGRKFSDNFSMQLTPSLVHRNLVSTASEKNDVLAVGTGARMKLSKRLAINAEYIYVLPDQLADRFTNSASIGLDIETGGHVFQLHFSNSTSMTDKGVITDTLDSWEDGDIHFGFNISRVFTIKKKSSEPKI